MAHGEVYAEEWGWDGSFEALVARIVADYAEKQDPVREAAWIAELDGRRVGCISCVRGEDSATAQLRILLVHPEGRGRGVGGALVDTCLDFARAAGYRRMVLWTADPLVAARKLYLDRGFVLTGEEPRRTFGADLIVQTYEADLGTSRL